MSLDVLLSVFVATFLANVGSLLLAYHLEDRRTRARRPRCEICGVNTPTVSSVSVDEQRVIRTVRLCQECHNESVQA